MSKPAVLREPETIKVRTKDGYMLSAKLFAPQDRKCVGTIVVLNAVGVPQDFYAKYSAWLASEGYSVLTFNYRGFEESTAKELRNCGASLSDWGRHDIDAAIVYQKGAYPELPLRVVAHSIGGHLFGFADHSNMVSSVLTITCGSGYWLHWPLRRSWPLGIIWYCVVPVISRVLGYLPGKTLGFPVDLPKGVGLEWASWARHPKYLLNAQGDPVIDSGDFDHFTQPIVGVSFSDDNMISKPAIDALHKVYRRADVTRLHFEPLDLGKKEIGHFDFFRSRNADLWPIIFQRYLQEER
ncbi:hypothetical protein MJD09_09335 [bacterium]|nr:hypothetical protein [bacterium]